MAAPRVVAYDPVWPVIADAWISRTRAALSVSGIATRGAPEHIGSTAVPGLAAKPYLDLQLLVEELPDAHRLESALAGLGFRRTLGSRPDSPGVHADIPRPGCRGERHEKLLLYADLSDSSGPIEGVILHVRLADSSFADFVIAFRDWLRVDQGGRAEYQRLKRALAEEMADAADYDDYTRAKSAFMDHAQRMMGWTGS